MPVCKNIDRFSAQTKTSVFTVTNNLRRKEYVMATQTSTIINRLNLDLMSPETKLEQMGVEELAQKCAHETDLFFAQREYDPSYGFELFRRAVRNKDERAFEVVMALYQPLVARWVKRQQD